MTLCVIWFYLLVLVLTKTYADTLEVAGDFKKISYFEGTSVARFNGWYWDSSFHIVLDTGIIYSMCRSNGAFYIGGNFTSQFREKNTSFLMRTNGWWTTDMTSPSDYIFAGGGYASQGYSNLDMEQGGVFQRQSNEGATNGGLPNPKGDGDIDGNTETNTDGNFLFPFFFLLGYPFYERNIYLRRLRSSRLCIVDLLQNVVASAHQRFVVAVSSFVVV
eukprot:Phypoly_transcript_15785.p1 GENE.Phypoly_transcript_15785~~Phypoly_transcript_15785.p1  ORF type:complete len:218 (+),score=16.75 Phypoly_transcript_15785:36-689(+)